MEACVQCRTFERTTTDGPSTATLSALENPSPEDQVKVYLESGIPSLVKHAELLGKVAQATERYTPLPAQDYQFYAAYLSECSPAEEGVLAGHFEIEASSMFIQAYKTGLFSDFYVLRHPETGECLLVAVIKDKSRTYYFKLAQWGAHLTSEAELRKRGQLVTRSARQMLARLTSLPASATKKRDRQGTRYLISYALLATAVGWTVLFTVGNWWVFALVSCALMFSTLGYVKHGRGAQGVPVAVRWIIGLSLAAVPISGFVVLNNWNTANNVATVLVCSAHQNKNLNQGNPPFNNDWQVATSQGTMTPIAGFYDGKYYPDNSGIAAKSLVGKWVRITWHGHIGNAVNSGMDNNEAYPPFITAATTLGPGNCG